jgi:cell division protein FtsB
MKNTPKNPNLSAQIDDAQIELESLQMRRKDECAAIESLDDKILKGDDGATKDAAIAAANRARSKPTKTYRNLLP